MKHCTIATFFIWFLLWSCSDADLPPEDVYPSYLSLSQIMFEEDLLIAYEGLNTVLHDRRFSVLFHSPDKHLYFDYQGKGRKSQRKGTEESGTYQLSWSIHPQGSQKNLLSVTNVPRMFSPIEPLEGIVPGRIYTAPIAHFYTNPQLSEGVYTIRVQLVDGILPLEIIDSAELDIYLPPQIALERGMTLSLEAALLEAGVLKEIKEITTFIEVSKSNQSWASARIRSNHTADLSKDSLIIQNFRLNDARYRLSSYEEITITEDSSSSPAVVKSEVRKKDFQTTVTPPRDIFGHVFWFQPKKVDDVTRLELQFIDEYGQTGKINLLLSIS